MSSLLNSVVEFAGDTGFAYVTPSMIVMWIVSFVLMYLAIVKKYEPLLLLPISLGALAVNIPSAGLLHQPGYPPGTLPAHHLLGRGCHDGLRTAYR